MSFQLNTIRSLRNCLISDVIPYLIIEITAVKTLDTIGNCQTPVFTVCVSQWMHKITNLWKFELNWLSCCEIIMKHPCHTKLCAFRWLIWRPRILNLRSRNQICGKLLLSQKLLHFRGSCFSQCLILPTSPHYSLPIKVLG